MTSESNKQALKHYSLKYLLAHFRTTVADMCLLLYDGTKHGIATLILLRIWSAIFYAPLKARIYLCIYNDVVLCRL